MTSLSQKEYLKNLEVSLEMQKRFLENEARQKKFDFGMRTIQSAYLADEEINGFKKQMSLALNPNFK